MSQQQTVLRVRTNKPSPVTVTGTTALTVIDTQGPSSGYTGTGTVEDPFIGSFGTSTSFIGVQTASAGTMYWNCTLYGTAIGNNYFSVFVRHPEDAFLSKVFDSWTQYNLDYCELNAGDVMYFEQNTSAPSGGTFNLYFVPDLEQVDYTIPTYDFLDLYSDIPITINKSFAEIEDISKRNSDYSLGVKLPGSKKNNRFFEDFFNVDSIGLYFDVLKKVPCNVLIDNESYFTGFMKLNSVSVKDSKIEYDVTLFSSVGDLYGKIGNNLLRDLNFRDVDYFMNHYFSKDNVLSKWRYETLKSDTEVPSNYFYPVVHNGYNYQQSGSFTNVAYTGITGTSLYTTTITGSWANAAAAYSAGADRYRINSPEDGVRDNQLKPSMNVYSLIQMIFKQNGYKMGGSFKNIPWFKLLYMYGYFSDDSTKLSYTALPPQTYSLDDVELRWTLTSSGSTRTWNVYVVKEGTGTPCFCSSEITGILTLLTIPFYEFDDYSFTIAPGSTGYTKTWGTTQFYAASSANVAISNQPMSYLPSQVNQQVGIGEGDYVDFGRVLDNQIKQIDILSSIAKKFNLLFIPDENNPYQINVEPYDYYVGTGNIYDWTDKLSYDRGFSVQPAQNFVESEIILTDLEDGDQGNVDYRNSNGVVYGYLKQTNPTDFKSQTKEIKTAFSPEVIRTWNPLNNPDYPAGAVKIPLGINYAESSQEVGNAVDWIYKGVKTKPKLFFNLGNFNPFLATGTTIGLTGVTTNYFKVTNASGTNPSGSLITPVISHTMPMGNPDTNKITNDSACILFQSANVTNNPNEAIGTYNTFTNNDMYELFYNNRISNIFNRETRFIDGYFNLSLNDIKNLKANDLIKINNQLFSWNSIVDFNLTNSELTKVQLLQYNTQYKTYPDRYFYYYYCDKPEYVYKFKTNFTADTIYDSLYYYSILYDYFVGALGGNVSGYTSSIQFGTGALSPYISYYIYEVSEETYNFGGGISYTFDPQRSAFLEQIEEEPVNTIYNQSNDVFLINSGQTLARLNVFTGCTEFTSAAASLGVITTGSTIPTGVTCFNFYTHFQTSGNTAPVIRDVLINDENTLFVGGGFRKYNNVTYGGITGSTGPNMIKLNTDGSVNNTFTNYGFGQTGQVYSIKKQSTGKLVVGGNFSSYSGNTKGPLVRLNENGTLDTTFQTTTIITGGSIQDLVILSDDKILLAGAYGLNNPANIQYFSRLNSNGTLDGTFQNSSVNDAVYDVDVQSDGKIYIAGAFTAVSGISKNGIARLNSDGTPDNTFNVGTGFNLIAGPATNIEIQPDGKVIVGGSFTSYNGTTGLQGICRLNTDGSLDNTFTTSIPGTAVGNAYRPKLLSNGKILVPLTIDGVNTLLRLNSNGSVDPTFTTGVFSGTYNFSTEDATAVDDNGLIYFAASFQTYNSRNMWGIVKLTENGTIVGCP